MNWETVIGLETHVQLLLNSKLFSGASIDFGQPPNTQACAVDLGLPGVLPVTNKEAVRMAVKFGLAVEATLQHQSEFVRKNYFYPDLPKGYQISQYEQPIMTGGGLMIALEGDQEANGEIREKWISFHHAHLEEDAGKSLHQDFHGMTGLDFNRAGTALLEIVSMPDLRSAQETVVYLRALHTLVRYLEISDANMQEGSFRCDVNISMRPVGQAELGTRVELKNLNSFRFVAKAIEYETVRQIDLLERGQTVLQETRLYDPDRHETRVMRTKEEANDYRYFPDPDLPLLMIEADWIESVRTTLPELPKEKQARFMDEYELGVDETRQLTASRALADYFETIIRYLKSDQVIPEVSIKPRVVAHWINGDLSARLNEHNLTIKESPVSPEQLAVLIQRIVDQTISGRIAKQVFAAMWSGESGSDPDVIIAQKGLTQISSDEQIEPLIDELLARSAGQVAQYKSGQQKVWGYFVGQIMKATEGKANPERVNQLLKKKLDEL